MRRWPMIAAAWLAACASGRVPRVGEPPAAVADPAAEQAYRKVLERYSDSQELYRVFETRAFFAASFQTPTFVEARVQRQGLFRVQPPTVVAQALESERARLAGKHSFFLGVHVSNPKFDDFDRKGSIWRLALVSGGAEVTPVAVTRLGRSSLDLRSLYPYLDEFWVAYWVSFPAVLPTGAPTVPPEVSEVTLRIASVVGRVDLRFPAR